MKKFMIMGLTKKEGKYKMVQFLKLLLISGIVENMLFLDFTTI
jgi:hypothetical protein